MKCVFSLNFAKNDEEFVEQLKKKIRIMWIVGVFGLVVAILGFSAEYYMEVAVSEYMLGVYCGAGMGLFGAAVAIIIRYNRLLKNEAKRKEARLQQTDERNIEISRKAMQMSALMLLVVLYAVGLIGGLFYPILMKVLLLAVCVFVLGYAISYKIIEKKS